MDWIAGVWEEPRGVWCEALREKIRNLCRRLNSENPTTAELKFLAMTPGPDGRASWRFPNVWNLDDPDSHSRLTGRSRPLLPHEAFDDGTVRVGEGRERGVELAVASGKKF